MTKKLVELFNMSEDEKKELPINIEIISEQTSETLDKIEDALPRVKGLESSDNEFDEISAMATSSYKDLMDLGFQVDSRFSSEIFSVAATMLNHSLTAKTAKANKKLKMIELQLKKMALDMKKPIEEKENEKEQSKVIDRNELLKLIINKNSNN